MGLGYMNLRTYGPFTTVKGQPCSDGFATVLLYGSCIKKQELTGQKTAGKRHMQEFSEEKPPEIAK